MRKKIDKLLDKKYTVGDFIICDMWILLVILLIIVCNNITHHYTYIDTLGFPGQSDKCYYNSKNRKLECLKPIPVKQYYEE